MEKANCENSAVGYVTTVTFRSAGARGVRQQGAGDEKLPRAVPGPGGGLRARCGVVSAGPGG